MLLCGNTFGTLTSVRRLPLRACSCDNGAGQLFPYHRCTLKQQPAGGDGRPSLATYASGSGVPWTSGYIVRPPPSSPAAAPPPPTGAPGVRATSSQDFAVPLLPSLAAGGNVQLLP